MGVVTFVPVLAGPRLGIIRARLEHRRRAVRVGISTLAATATAASTSPGTTRTATVPAATTARSSTAATATASATGPAARPAATGSTTTTTAAATTTKPSTKAAAAKTCHDGCLRKSIFFFAWMVVSFPICYLHLLSGFVFVVVAWLCNVVVVVVVVKNLLYQKASKEDIRESVQYLSNH
jgi:hypothetical protein